MNQSNEPKKNIPLTTEDIVQPPAKEPEEQEEEPENRIKNLDVTDTWVQQIELWRQKCMPYQRYIMIIGIITLIFLVVFLGYAYGGLKVCTDLDGLLDEDFKCHPDYTPERTYNSPIPNIVNFTIHNET